MNDISHYGTLAELFRYPSDGMIKHVEKWKSVINRYPPSLSQKLDSFLAHINSKSLAFRQEYYISTFDVQAVCHLDVGYVLFGDDYKRGSFLVNIKKEQIKVSNDCGSELPDHLPNILTLLPKMDPVLAEELICTLLITAIQEMIGKFKGNSNVYRGLLEMLLDIMEADYPSPVFQKYNVEVSKKPRDQDARDLV